MIRNSNPRKWKSVSLLILQFQSGIFGYQNYYVLLENSQRFFNRWTAPRPPGEIPSMFCRRLTLTDNLLKFSVFEPRQNVLNQGGERSCKRRMNTMFWCFDIASIRSFLNNEFSPFSVRLRAEERSPCVVRSFESHWDCDRKKCLCRMIFCM